MLRTASFLAYRAAFLKCWDNRDCLLPILRPEGRVLVSRYLSHACLSSGLVCRTAAVLEQYGFANAKEWLTPWEAVWQKNLKSCTPNGDCLIQLT